MIKIDIEKIVTISTTFTCYLATYRKNFNNSTDLVGGTKLDCITNSNYEMKSNLNLETSQLSKREIELLETIDTRVGTSCAFVWEI